MDELILNEFYNKVLPMVKDNKLEIDGWKFNIEFQTIIPGTDKYLNDKVEETLIINNVELFNTLLIEYTKRMLEIISNSRLRDIDYVYYNGNKKFMIDFIVSNLWNNVTDTDLNNPVEYLKTRINFLDDPLYDFESKIVYIEDIDFLENSNIEYQICLNNPILETTYSFKPSIVRNKDENEIFELPRVLYGINNDVCYIYAVQRESKAIDYMPIRYKAKECAINKKISKLKEKLSDEEIEELLNNAQNEQISLQGNITDKFLRNFRRLEYQLENIKITSYPKDVDSTMHLILTDDFNNSDNILNRLYQEESYKKKI